MLSETDYIVAWIAYLSGCAVMLLLVWRLSGSWSPGVLRTLCRFLPAVILLVPARADIEQASLAPAFFVAAFEFAMSSEPEAGELAALRLAYALGIFALCLIVYYLARRYFRTQ